MFKNVSLLGNSLMHEAITTQRNGGK